MEEEEEEEEEEEVKKLFGLIAAAMVLSIPLATHASWLGTGYIDLGFSGPAQNGYYLDYDGTVTSSAFGYTTPWVEVFCVSSQNLADGTFAFYTITRDLDAVFVPGTFQRLSMAAWIADHWTEWISTDVPADIAKGEAQKAVWKIMGVMNITGTDGTDFAIYQAALSHSGEANDHWYFADSIVNQDYLTPAPVPEPGTLLLLGTGLLGLGARAWRRRASGTSA